MKQLSSLLAFAFCFTTASQAFSAEGKDSGGSGGGESRQGFGLNLALGFPFLTQAGVDIYLFDNLGLSLGYGNFNAKFGGSTIDLVMPEVILKWHPFGGVFFMGGGVGEEKLVSKATDSTSGQTAEIKVTAMTAIAKIGWMWGSNNGGFWYGLDLSYIRPSGAKTEITSSLPTTNETYKEVQDQAKRFGEMAYGNFTFARLGWMF
ncbi:MAG: hypothetical protein V4692_03910 [Bdellovibrionota bacterium]